jgi:phage FluMu protein gp41
MSIVVTLEKGITIGKVTHKDAELREATALDVIEATVKAERVVMVPAGFTPEGEPVLTPQLVPSPTNVGVYVLLRRIVRIGKIKGPIDELYLDKLSPEDFHLLQQGAENYARLALEVAHEGRPDSAGQSTA